MIDGAAALTSAIQRTFGSLAKIQRCQIHKLRSVLSHFQDHLQANVMAVLREAWAMGDTTVAKRRLERLASSLDADHPGAAASVREGLDETLTLQKLGVDGRL